MVQYEVAKLLLVGGGSELALGDGGRAWALAETRMITR